MIRNEPGWLGSFTRHEAPGAWPNATRVRKVNSEEPGETPDGTEGAVLGSLHHPEVGYFYFIEWVDKPFVAVGCMALKLERLDANVPEGRA